VYFIHLKIKAFVKICAKNLYTFHLKACINVYVNLTLKTYVKHSKDYMLSLQLQEIIGFYEFKKKN
jgi:hypothetical protein